MNLIPLNWCLDHGIDWLSRVHIVKFFYPNWMTILQNWMTIKFIICRIFIHLFSGLFSIFYLFADLICPCNNNNNQTRPKYLQLEVNQGHHLQVFGLFMSIPIKRVKWYHFVHECVSNRNHNLLFRQKESKFPSNRKNNHRAFCWRPEMHGRNYSIPWYRSKSNDFVQSI